MSEYVVAVESEIENRFDNEGDALNAAERYVRIDPEHRYREILVAIKRVEIDISIRVEEVK